jgi:D-glycero-D-manno-heptose 1,7-bisphosphate phosphatase
VVIDRKGIPAVFFDRDGTIIESPFYGGKPRAENNVEKVTFVENSLDTIARVTYLGYTCFFVTNQPDVNDGIVSIESVEMVNKLILSKSKIVDYQSCYTRPKSPEESSSCMKPSPMMILNLAERWNVDLRKSWVVGDLWKDVEAGRRANCRTILIEKFYSQPELCAPNHKVKHIAEVVDILQVKN